MTKQPELGRIVLKQECQIRQMRDDIYQLQVRNDYLTSRCKSYKQEREYWRNECVNLRIGSKSKVYNKTTFIYTWFGWLYDWKV